MYYLFDELSHENIRVCYNLFVEHHGKSSRDQHFSVLSMFLKKENFCRKLISSQDIVTAINNQQNLSNQQREKHGLEPIVTIPLVHRYKNDKVINIKIVQNLKSYYNFFVDKNFSLCSVVISDLREPINIPFQNKQCLAIAKKKNQPEIENMIESSTVNFKAIESKHENIKNLIRLKEDYFKKNAGKSNSTK